MAAFYIVALAEGDGDVSRTDVFRYVSPLNTSVLETSPSPSVNYRIEF